MDERTRRLIDQVHETLCDNEEEFLRAEGTAVVRVLKQGDVPRITLDSRKLLIKVGRPDLTGQAPRLGGEIRPVADDVRRAMMAEQILVTSAREIVIEIHLRGARPSFDISYRTHRG